MRRKSRNYTLLILGEEGQVFRFRLLDKYWPVFLGALALVVAVTALLAIDYLGDKLALRRLQREQDMAAQPANLESPTAPATGMEPGLEKSGRESVALIESPLRNPDKDLVREALKRKAALVGVERYYEPPYSALLSIPNRWPLHGWVTSEFGPRWIPTGQEPSMHTGLDIVAPVGTEVRAPAAGVVIYNGEQPGYGLYLILRHGHGLTTHYGHLSRALAAVGQTVKPGEVIGRSGNTGQSTGPHLHYEVRLFNIPVYPRRYLPGPQPPVPTLAAASTPQPNADLKPAADVPPPAMIDVPTQPTPEPVPFYGN